MKDAQTGGRQGTLAVIVTGPAERLVLDVVALMLQEFPRVGGSAFQHAVACMRARFQGHAAEALTDTAMLLAEMQKTGKLPKVRLGRRRPIEKDELLIIALLAALQHGQRARAIEAAIALLDSGHVYGVLAAARSLASLLAEQGLRLRPIGSELFNHAAGYSAVGTPLMPPLARTPATEAPKKPLLRLLKTA